ncbi:NAD(P)/FAD-dependent oxidoreductase [Rubrobacter marinus]|uniref:NADH:ubiquinone reductase (non-electrogenic) n=1 Tax=Rubrobacter marinus TaxID=2653852 RepID=A0A6G8PY96_9ACTN|nr:NAD(P)/FAD-dependent oxidoreductase [Rubrobacter marinus]QIN79135.1 NAD(P)/FAD-dependent oxidoreductase [Rubrobacter marinus]
MGRLLNGGLVVGGTVLALGALRRALNPRPRYAPWEKPRYEQFDNKVCIVGGGFGGYSAATKITELTKGREDVGVLVVARDNFFTFWPMVPGIVSSDIDSRNVAQPLRRALITAGASFRRAKLKEIDHENKRIVADGGLDFPYDQLVISLGGQPNFFGIPGVEEHALHMRGVEDAERIRNRVIERFEEVSLMRGEIPESKLTFVVIGGGATGTEVASEIHTLVHEALAPDYPNIDPNRVRVFLLEGLPQILPELDPSLQRAARTRLYNENIEVMTSTFAEEVTEDEVRLKGGEVIQSENVIWTAGNRPNVAIHDLGLPVDERNGIKVDEYLRVEGYPGIWAIGDCAAIQDVREGAEGRFVPPTAQAAGQEGYTVAKNILATIDGREDELEKFEYKPLGQLVELGSDFAVNEVMGVRFSGLAAAIFWRMAYLVRLNSPQSRVRIAADWISALFVRPAVTQIRGTSQE